MGVDNLSACPDKSFEQNSKFEFFCVLTPHLLWIDVKFGKQLSCLN